MKTVWHPGYAAVIATLVATTAVLALVVVRQNQHQTELSYKASDLQEYVDGLKEDILELDWSYRLDVRTTAGWLAERQKRIGHATCLSKGMEVLDPAPFAGYPVCQMGCDLSVQTIAGVDVCVEEEFITAYNAPLRGVTETNNPNQMPRPVP